MLANRTGRWPARCPRERGAGDPSAAGTGSAQPPDLPVLFDGLQGWVSTTKGQFLFGDGTVKVVSDSVDAKLYVGMSSIGGNDFVDN